MSRTRRLDYGTQNASSFGSHCRLRHHLELAPLARSPLQYGLKARLLQRLQLLLTRVRPFRQSVLQLQLQTTPLT
jgi:hypothetical protein